MILVFAGVLLGYANSGKTRVTQRTPPVAEGVNVALDLVSIDTVGRQITLRVSLFPEGRYHDQDDDTFAVPLRVVSRSLKESQSFSVDAGQPVGGSFEFDLPVDGQSEIYPFDRYRYAYNDPQQPKATVPAPLIRIEEIQDDDEAALPVAVGGTAIEPVGLAGWTERWKVIGDASTLYVELNISRSGAVLGAVGAIVFLMIAMACLAATVAWSTATGRRPVEPTFAGWFAAMLFALIPLQSFLPGVPPVGAWIDVCIFLWVEIVLLASMGVFILSWFRYRGRPDYSGLQRRKQESEHSESVSAEKQSEDSDPQRRHPAVEAHDLTGDPSGLR
jgi:hypothetical protein